MICKNQSTDSVLRQPKNPVVLQEETDCKISECFILIPFDKGECDEKLFIDSKQDTNFIPSDN